jgi:2-C-methyl-D-erythritol 4-phosphate cytidylyltransferase
MIVAGDGGVLAPLAGKPVIAHSVAAFEAAAGVDAVVLVAGPGVAAGLAGPEVTAGLAGPVIEHGGPRAESVYHALRLLGGSCDNVLVHDAAWPLVSPRSIEACAAALHTGQAVCAAVAASDTMVAVENDLISERPPRPRLRCRQYPQGFSLPVIRRGYELARADPAFRATDECGIVLRYLPQVRVHLVAGSERGFAVTGPLGLEVAEAILGAGR